MTPKQVERIRAEFLKVPVGGHSGPIGYPPRFVEAIYNDYMDHGEVMAAIAPRWNRQAGSLSHLLAKWGLREKTPERTQQIKARQRDKGGRVMAANRATPAELDEIIASATKIAIPPTLQWEFKNWPMEKRAWFLKRLRDKVRPPNARPEKPFSSNVTPFDYTTTEARAIKERLNIGLSSRQAICRIDLASQGVIYKGELYFWAAKSGYQRRGHWKRGIGRALLHRIIWEEVNGPLPPKHVVYFRDENHNNFEPDNLGIMSMNENARRNQAAALLRTSREQTALLLQRSQQGKEKQHGLIEALYDRKAA
jgi:hypothetical protein